MVQESLYELRRRVAKRHGDATKKISRIRNRENDPVELAGTKYDPRLSARNIRRYNRPQLERYLARLDSFMSRSTYFASDHAGNIIPANEIRAYRKVEARQNRAAKRLLKRIGDVVDPVSGLKLKDVHSSKSDRIISAESANRVFAETRRNISNVNGVKSLRALTENIERRMSRDYRKKLLGKGRESVAKMLTDIGASELIPEMNGLSDRQFLILFEYTNFTNSLKFIYEKDYENDDMFNSTMSEIRGWINGAKGFPKS